MEKETLTSLEKALVILEQLGKSPFAYTPSELSKKTGISRTSIYRILATLEKNDAIMLDHDTKKYKIGCNMYHIGMSYLTNYNYKTRIQDLLSEISTLANESVGIAVRSGDNIISIFESEVVGRLKYNDIPGRYYSPNKGAYGKCIMAFEDPDYVKKYLNSHTFTKDLPNVLTTKEELMAEYEKIRRQGYASHVEEIGIGVAGIGVPIFDQKGKIKACCGGAFFFENDLEEKMENLKTVLFRYRKKLEKTLP